jgi:hypothetical protein
MGYEGWMMKDDGWQMEDERLRMEDGRYLGAWGGIQAEVLVGRLLRSVSYHSSPIFHH